MRISDWSSDVCSSDLRARDRPVAAVVDARRHFVEDGSLVGGEKFAGEDADIVELGGDLRHQRARFRLLIEDDLRRGQAGSPEDAAFVDVDGRVPEADFAVDAANEDDRNFVREGDRRGTSLNSIHESTARKPPY